MAKDNEKQNTNLYIDADLYKKVKMKQLEEKGRINFSELVTKLLKNYLKEG